MFSPKLADLILAKLARHKDLNLVVSDSISIASAATTAACSIPAGAYVKQVSVYNPGASAFSSADIDVGDGDSTDRYVDGMTGLGAYDIATAPVPGNGVASDEVAGHYYASADTIDVKVNGTADGSVKVMAWYFMV